MKVSLVLVYYGVEVIRMNGWKERIQKEINQKIFNIELANPDKFKEYLRTKLLELFRDESNYNLVGLYESDLGMELRVLNRIFKVEFVNETTMNIHVGVSTNLVFLGEISISLNKDVGVYFREYNTFGLSENKLMFTEDLLDRILSKSF